MMVSQHRRVVLLGKTGAGKSSAGNTILGEELFKSDYSLSSTTMTCNKESRTIDGRQITLIDTSGFLDTRMSDNQLKPEIIKCITECTPGIHAFLIVLKVERYTAHEMEICTKIQESFSDEAFKYATVLFTHGYQLKGKTIQEFVKMNEDLNDLVQKCGGRCHVIDNEHWNQDHQDEFRSNRFQVAELLKTIDQMVEQNRGGCYTNEMLQAVEEAVQAEKQPRKKVHSKLLIKIAGTTTGVLVGALLGVVTVSAALAIGAVKHLKEGAKALKLVMGAAEGGGAAAGEAAAAGGGAGAGGIVAAGGGGGAGGGGAAAAEEAGAVAATAAGGAADGGGIGAAGGAALAGGIAGGIVGFYASEKAETVVQAAEAAAKAVYEKAKAVLDKV